MFSTPISGAAVILLGIFVWALASGHPVVALALAIQWLLVRDDRTKPHAASDLPPRMSRYALSDWLIGSLALFAMVALGSELIFWTGSPALYAGLVAVLALVAIAWRGSQSNA